MENENSASNQIKTFLVYEKNRSTPSKIKAANFSVTHNPNMCIFYTGMEEVAAVSLQNVYCIADSECIEFGRGKGISIDDY